MITIPCINGSQQRELTDEEKSTVTSILCDGDDYFFYQGDEPEADPVVIVTPPNWNGLTQSLWGSSLMQYAAINANPNGFSLLLKVLTDGEAGSASENSFLVAFNFCSLSLTNLQKAELNGFLTNNNFTIQIS